MPRREFSKAVKVEIIRRATVSGVVTCEGCGLALGPKPWHIDHTIPDALQIDKRRKLTADDGKLLGVECCHNPKTREQDVPAIAEAKRREAKHLGITKPAGKLRGPAFPKPDKQRSSKPGLPPKIIYATRTAS